MNQKAIDYIKSNTLDLESNNRMDSTGYVQYAVSEAKAYGAISIAEQEMKKKCCIAFRNFMLRATLASVSGEQLDFEKEFEDIMSQI
ncbi:hypothetical protein [Bacteroides sp.]|uniref:hypothetical protein n=1 Tax=Bacteroides sp. TaxID=29523 RepID=UPI002A814454|nr:hypothetical protein [Bacteroides sp.]